MEPEEMKEYLMDGEVIILYRTKERHLMMYKFNESVGLEYLTTKGAWEESAYSIDEILNEAHMATVY